MNWNKVKLKSKNTNLPKIEEMVLWATNEKSPSETTFYKFIGRLTADGKYIDTGWNRYKLTNNYWWMNIEDPSL